MVFEVSRRALCLSKMAHSVAVQIKVPFNVSELSRPDSCFYDIHVYRLEQISKDECSDAFDDLCVSFRFEFLSLCHTCV